MTSASTARGAVLLAATFDQIATRSSCFRNNVHLGLHPSSVFDQPQSSGLHTCQSENTKTTEIFGLICFITPTVPRCLGILVVNHVNFSYENTLTHNILRFTGIKKSLNDFPKHLVALFEAPCIAQSDIVKWDRRHSRILRQDRVMEGYILIQHNFNVCIH